MKNGFSLRGLKKILLPRHEETDSLDAEGVSALAAFGPLPGITAGKKGGGLVEFLGQVNLFEEFTPAELARLARSAHERSYGDGESIYQQGTPGAALFLVRKGVVEILRRKRNGEEVSVLLLEPPASFAEQAALGADVVRWTSARAHGPVSLVAIGSSDLDALGRTFPLLANKILQKLAQIMAIRLQLLLEAEYFGEEAPAGSSQNVPQP
jgi:CRP/FNR family transcriptional regulator, cyclic AMP receptor protein